MVISNNKLITAAIVLLLVLLAVFWSSYPKEDGLPPENNNTTLSDIQWRVGASQQYQVKSDSTIQLNMGHSGTQSMRVMFDGLLNMVTLAVDNDSALVGMKLSSLDLQIGGSPDPESVQALTGTPFRVRFESGGVPSDFEFPDSLTAEQRNILKNMVQMFQVTMSDKPSWVAHESNATGGYEATYQRDTSPYIHKIKRHLVESSKVAMLNNADITSQESFRIDSHYNWLAEMSVKENIYSLGKTGVQISNYATLKMIGVTNKLNVSHWDFAAANTPAVNKVAKTAAPVISKEKALQQIQHSIQELDTTKKGRTILIHRIRDLLRVDDGLPAALLKEMKQQQLSDRTQADLYLAFELAGSPAAQAALISVTQGASWPARDALRAIVALAGIDEPTPGTREALWEIVDSGSVEAERRPLLSAATYALGSLGKAMQQKSDPDYTDLRERLLNGTLSNVGSEHPDKSRADFVLAIGNTHDATLASHVVDLLNDDAPAVRRAAALSLGLLDTEQSADQMMSRMKQEQNGTVRGAIAKSLLTWETPTADVVASIRRTVQSESDANTRYYMTRFLGQNMDKYPENKQVLQTLLKKEPSKKIRQQIANTLAATR